ncbi:MAG: efflux RND transporter permease subunit, partial [Phycisphaerales bacterium]|nr:efflux RND transporter permease subunit [Phycisphaerales bacterium]
MWIVRLALRRPYTFLVAAMLVTLLWGYVFFFKMSTDIFPNIDIPVASVIFNYTGMSAADMDGRIATPFERFVGTTVNDIQRIESQSLNGLAIVKIYFQPTAKIEMGIAQVTAVSQTAIRAMPPGTQPPLVIQYSASDVPILQLSLGSDVLDEQKVFDQAVNVLRLQLITIPGLQTPYPYGGKQRQIMVDLDPEKLYSYGLSATDVSNAVNAQNLILPGGSTKIGSQEYQVYLNSSPTNIDAMNDLPIKSVNGKTVFIRDVARVRDGFSVQTNMVHANGKRGVLMTIYKAGGASTVEVVDRVKAALPRIKQMLPPELKIDLLLDQSVFVRASVEGVLKEAGLAAGLTGLMILLFLGSWRSTLIVVISIPLSIFMSIIVLYFLGETLNVMTLGGMALAVGILVDDATVAIENIHRNLHQRKRLVTAILDGSEQIAVPAFVSTLCICIVFVPVVFIEGAAKYLFTPLSMAVVFAMLTSYVLSRTLVPTMVHYLLAGEVERYGGVLDASDPHAAHAIHAREAAAHGLPTPKEDLEFGERVSRWFKSTAGKVALMSLLAILAACVVLIYLPMSAEISFLKAPHHWAWEHWRTLAQIVLALAAIVTVIRLMVALHDLFNRIFEWFRRLYGGILAWCLSHRLIVVTAFVLVVVLSCCLFPLVGQDFFPSVDAGQMRLHVRCPAGTRIEETAERFARIEDEIRRAIPNNELDTLIDNIGIPYSGINLSLSDGSMISPADGEIIIKLKETHRPTAQYMRQLRKRLPSAFPDSTFNFAAADIVTQVLNFGLAAPIDIQVAGPLANWSQNELVAREIQRKVITVPGVVDVRLQQVPHTPDFRVTVDRGLASLLGVAQRDVANALLISLSSSNQTAPNFWLDPRSGVNYNIYVQTPQYLVSSLNALENTPIPPSSVPATPDNTQVLSNLAVVSRGNSATNMTHTDVMPTFDVLLSVQGTDLGSVSRTISEILKPYNEPGKLPRGSRIILRGQVESMSASYQGLSWGLVGAVILVYLLMVINFQSWLDPLIILMALPGAIAGILWMLWATNTPISVPALMGAIMSIGVATANSILMITFANDQRKVGLNSTEAALAAGWTRL